MIVVTGTKRAGTSMWMQILIGAGLPYIGEPFPLHWEAAIRQANPRGFYESRLRHGVYYATNPDPKTGAYLAPGATRHHAVKIFIPGVVRSDVAFLHRVIVSVRDWRSYTRSLAALRAQESAWLRENAGKGDDPGVPAPAGASPERPVPLPVEWFLENYDLVRDFAIRRYPLSLVSYDRLLDDPERVVGRILEWLGVGDLDGALGAIVPDLRRSPDLAPTAEERAVDDRTREVFDAFYEAVHERSALPRSLVPRLNETWTRLTKEYGELSRERGRSSGSGGGRRGGA